MCHSSSVGQGTEETRDREARWEDAVVVQMCSLGNLLRESAVGVEAKRASVQRAHCLTGSGTVTEGDMQR